MPFPESKADDTRVHPSFFLAGSLLLALTRIFGISFGVLLSEITSCLIFPKSATGAALSNLRKALENLTDLNAMVWRHGPLSRPEWKGLVPEPSTYG